MRSYLRPLVPILALIAVTGTLILLFPSAYKFVEAAARELRYFWWLILLVVLGAWLIWGIGRKPKQ
jgi:hypothetical protein